MTPGTRNFHVPLPRDLYSRLREEARHTGRPATTVAREAISRWLEASRRAALRESIEAYAVEHAGTGADLDRELEAAAVASLLDAEGATR